MNKFRFTLFVLLVGIVFSELVFAQDSLSHQNCIDSLSLQNKLSLNQSQKDEKSSCRINVKTMIIPGLCFVYGVAGLKVDALRNLNFSTNNELKEDKVGHTIFDNYSQYTPAVMTFGLNLTGVKGKHNFKDLTLIFITSQLISSSIVYPLKMFTKEERPDGSDNHSFPSGHTAAAFSSAQLLFREYQDKNIWLALSGYPMAVFTATYRVINNKHWISDVVAGAGIGFTSTEFAYCLYPKIQKLFHRKKKSKSSFAFVPYYSTGGFGLSLAKTF